MKKIYGITNEYEIVESAHYEIENIGTHGVPFYSYKLKEHSVEIEQNNISESFEEIKEKLNVMLVMRIKTVENKLTSLTQELDYLKSKIIK
jgi:hypothetical protein